MPKALNNAMIRIAGALAMCSLTLPGCMYRSSGDLRLGGTVELSTISAPISPKAGHDRAEDSPARPSLNGLDRSHWPAQRVVAPVEIVMTIPAFTVYPRYGETPRDRGFYPTPVAALQTDGGAGIGIAEGLAAPIRAALDVPLAPIRLRRFSPGVAAYERTPRPGAAATLVAPRK